MDPKVLPLTKSSPFLGSVSTGHSSAATNHIRKRPMIVVTGDQIASCTGGLQAVPTESMFLAIRFMHIPSGLHVLLRTTLPHDCPVKLIVDTCALYLQVMCCLIGRHQYMDEVEADDELTPLWLTSDERILSGGSNGVSKVSI